MERLTREGWKTAAQVPAWLSTFRESVHAKPAAPQPLVQLVPSPVLRRPTAVGEPAAQTFLDPALTILVGRQPTPVPANVLVDPSGELFQKACRSLAALRRGGEQRHVAWICNVGFAAVELAVCVRITVPDDVGAYRAATLLATRTPAEATAAGILPDDPAPDGPWHPGDCVVTDLGPLILTLPQCVVWCAAPLALRAFAVCRLPDPLDTVG